MLSIDASKNQLTAINLTDVKLRAQQIKKVMRILYLPSINSVLGLALLSSKPEETYC